MSGLRKTFGFFLLVLLLAFGLLLAYALPQHVVVYVSGDQVQRMDRNVAATDAAQAVGATRDVKVINAYDPLTKETYVFRNEDTRFGFPWYLKFDSAEVQAQSQRLSHVPDQYVLIRYYGWRIAMFDAFPNAVKVEPWPNAEEPFPVFNTIFFVLLGLIVLVLWWKWRKFQQRRAAKV